MRIDRLLANRPDGSRQHARRWLATGVVKINGDIVMKPDTEVTRFCVVELAGTEIQRRQPRYFMLNKPDGYLSATQDAAHPTVMELLNEQDTDQLHIAGRLDRFSTGLLLLTDDGQWSRKLTTPEKTIAKVYRVSTANPIAADAKERFAAGIYFGYEGITTRPVQLDVLDANTALMTLHEGRYHQIKRMFGRYRNPVTSIHRQQIGSLALDPLLAPGEYRSLSADEVAQALIGGCRR